MPAAAPRRPIIAFLLSLPAPGLGHVYAGRGRRALWAVLMSFAVILAAALLAMTLPPAWQSRLLISVGIAVTLAVAWDAVTCARAAAADYQLQRYNRWWVYALTLAILAATANPWVMRALLARSARAVEITNDAMAPTLLAGDAVLVQPMRDSVFIGDLVEARVDSGDRVLRVVGVPGSRVEERAGTLIDDGIAIEEPWVQHRGSATWGPVVVPEGRYLLMSDARDTTRSPAPYALVERNDIRGQPVVIVWSRDPKSGAVRHDRIGVTPL